MLFCRNVEKNLYFALIYSSLLYCVEIYGTAKYKYINPLIIKCNSVLRILQDKPRTYRVSCLYNNYNTLPVNLLHKLCILKLMHRFIYNRCSVPTVFSNLFVCNNEVHTYNTRSKFDFSLNYVRCHNSLAFIAPVMWRKLPLHVRNCSSSSQFLNMCKLELFKEL